MIYEKEIKRSIMWMFRSQNKENFGWSWVKNISPNEQNTAEVVYSVLQFVELLSSEQIELITQAVRRWLLLPQKHAVLTIDWVWVGIALSKYSEMYEYLKPDFDKEFVDKDVKSCVQAVLEMQNFDGGWGDHKGDLSTAFRTAIVLFFLEIQKQSKESAVSDAMKKAAVFLLKLQNTDGGFGNVLSSNLDKSILTYYAGIEQCVVESQYLSSVSATGYALWALSEYNKYMYGHEISKAADYLKGSDFSSGYEIFLELGLRRSTLFTFRHFGAAWMGLGLLSSGRSSFTSPEILKLIKHFLSLQDTVDGGFRCSRESEVYTWSNSNALMFFRLVINSIESMSGLDYTDIVADYYMNRQ